MPLVCSWTKVTDLEHLVALIMVHKEAFGLFPVLSVLEILSHNLGEIVSGRLLRLELVELAILDIDNTLSIP